MFTRASGDDRYKPTDLGHEAPRPDFNGVALNDSGTTRLELTTQAPFQTDGTHKPTDAAQGAPPDSNGEANVDNGVAEEESLQLAEGGWGWLVCFTSMGSFGFTFAVVNNFGILYVVIREKYAEGTSNVSFKTAWVGSLCAGLVMLFSSVAGIIGDKIGLRSTGMIGGALAFTGMMASAFVEELELLYLTYGIILGLGFALAATQALIIPGHYFHRRLGLVNGIVSLGSPVYTVGLALLLPELLSAIGLRYTLIFLSGMCLLLIVYAAAWKSVLPKKDSSNSQYAMGCLNRRIWRNKGYVLYLIGYAVSFFGYFMPFIHLVKYVEDEFSSSDGNLMVLYLSITSAVSRIVTGKVVDNTKINPIRFQQVGFFCIGVIVGCIPFVNTFEELVGLMLLFGVFDGFVMGLLSTSCFYLVGAENASQAVGFLFGGMSISMVVGSPVAGFLYDNLDSYRVAFWIFGCSPIIGSFILHFAPNNKPVTQNEETVSAHTTTPSDEETDAGYRNQSFNQNGE